MALKEQLMDDLKTAMKEKDVVRKNTVQSVRAAILQTEKDNKTDLNDDGVIDVIAKELKRRRDVLPEYEKSGREDAIAELNREIEVLSSYLPELLSEEELEQIVLQVMQEVGAASMKDMGKIMAAVTPKTRGRADGRQINQIVKSKLS